MPSDKYSSKEEEKYIEESSKEEEKETKVDDSKVTTLKYNRPNIRKTLCSGSCKWRQATEGFCGGFLIGAYQIPQMHRYNIQHSRIGARNKMCTNTCVVLKQSIFLF